MLGGEGPHDRGQRFHPGRRGGDDLDPTGGDALDGVDGGVGGVQSAQDPAGRFDEVITGVGGDDSASDAVEQRHSEFAFETGDRLGERWLGDLQVFGGPAEVAVVDHRDEVPQLPGVHSGLLERGRPGEDGRRSDGDSARVTGCCGGGLGKWDGSAQVSNSRPDRAGSAAGLPVV